MRAFEGRIRFLSAVKRVSEVLLDDNSWGKICCVGNMESSDLSDQTFSGSGWPMG